MTEQYDGPPRTRRERRERELAAQRGAQGAAAVESTDTASVPEQADAAARQTSATEPTVEAPAAADDSTNHSAPVAPKSWLQSSVPPASAPADASSVPSAPSLFGAKPISPTDVVDEQLAPTQAADLSALFGDTASPEGVEDAPADEPKRIGRFFGRRRRSEEQESVDQAESVDIFEELAKPALEQPAPAVEVPAPSLALPGGLVRDEVQQLDTVDDAAVDASEIDEVVSEFRPRSSKRVAEATPAELEDRRVAQVADDDDDSVAGPIRSTSTSRMPVIVNVVSDTTEHHIADVLEETGSIERQSVGTGTSSITANALVLPSTGADEQIQIESEDGLIVTGSIDLPDGIASSGRSRGTVDGTDLDADAVHGEVRNPELQPVRASKAVSSYANARVQIAPERRSSRAWPIAIGSGAGVVAVAAGVFIAGLAFNWF